MTGRKLMTAIIGCLTAALALTGCALVGPQTGSAAAGAGTGAGPQVVEPTTVSHPVVPLSALLDPKSGKFFGLEVNGAPDSMNPVTDVAASLSDNPNLIGQYVEWNKPFDTMAATNTLNYGALYYMVWEPFDVSVQSIASGASDAYITKFAKSVKAFGDPVALSFGHEMNGNWYPWGTNGATPSEFVAAWRHIHNIFASVGADNVIWVWNPNIINPMPDVQLQPYWPGNAYVNWVGITGYFPTTGADTFAELYGPTMSEIREFTSKPFIIAETAVETGPNQTQDVNDLISGVKASSDVLGFVWFNYDKSGVDWTVTDRPEVRAAVASALSGLPLVSLDK